MIHFSFNLWHKSLLSHVINLPYSTDALWASSGIAFTCNNFSNVPLTGVRQTKSSSTATRPKQNESNSIRKKTLPHSFRSLPPSNEKDRVLCLSLYASLSLSALSGQAFHHPGTHFQASHANTRAPGNCFPSAHALAPSSFRSLLPLPLPSAGQLNVESHSH